MKCPVCIRLLAAIALAAPAVVNSGQPASNQYRIVGSGPASVAASTASPVFLAQFAGGSGAPVGISASTNSSAVAGPVSAELPTARIFRGNFED